MADDDDRTATPDAETPPELSERRFAENLRAAREDVNMSQVRLAEAMAGRGWPWRQQTVARVENGQRMVRLGEALAVASILNTDVTTLTASTRETSAIHLLALSTWKVKEAFEEIVRSTQTLLHNQGRLRITLAEAEQADYYDSPLVRREAEQGILVVALTPEQAVSKAREDAEPAVDGPAGPAAGNGPREAEEPNGVH